MSLRRSAGSIVIGLLMLFCGASAAFAQTATPAAVAPQAGADQTYVLGTADVIEVSVLGQADFTTRGRIAEDGTIRLPYLGVVAAANRTSGQFADQVSKALEKGGFFVHAIVKVDIVSFASRYVTVLGDVGAPGLVPVDRAYRLSEIIARVGGIKETGADYVILRGPTGPERQLPLKDLATGDETQDPYVAPGDKIYVPKAEIFYISGQVHAPGAYAITDNMTVRMAIARGGGVTDLGSDKKLKLTRHGKAMSGVDLEAKIQPGDVLVVGERLF